MFTFLFSVYVVAHAVFLIWAIRLWRRDGAPGAPIIAMIAAGLVYDNFIIAIGATIGAGELLITLSWPRFALHAIFTPFTAGCQRGGFSLGTYVDLYKALGGGWLQ